MKRQTKFQKWASRVGLLQWLELGTPENWNRDAMKAAESAYKAGFRAGRAHTERLSKP